MRYHNITKDDMLNGDGLRVVLWVAGCSHGCKECHTYVTGITFSGGDPLHIQNRETIGELIQHIRNEFPTKTIWVYTGYLWDDVKELPYIKDIDVLVDGRFILEQKDPSLQWRGSANQRVIDVKKTLETGEIVLHSCENNE